MDYPYADTSKQSLSCESETRHYRITKKVQNLSFRTQFTNNTANKTLGTDFYHF